MSAGYTNKKPIYLIIADCGGVSGYFLKIEDAKNFLKSNDGKIVKTWELNPKNWSN